MGVDPSRNQYGGGLARGLIEVAGGEGPHVVRVGATRAAEGPGARGGEGAVGRGVVGGLGGEEGDLRGGMGRGRLGGRKGRDNVRTEMEKGMTGEKQ